MCDLTTTSARIWVREEARNTARICAILTAVPTFFWDFFWLLSSQKTSKYAVDTLAKLARVCGGHARQAGAPEGTADTDETGACYEYRQRTSCGVGYAVRGWRLHSFATAKMMEVVVELFGGRSPSSFLRRRQTMCMPSPRLPTTLMRVEAARNYYKQVQS